MPRHRSPIQRWAAGWLLACTAGGALATSDTYTVDVWASVLFGTDGRAQEVRLHEAERQPAAFIDAVRARLQKARIDPPQVNGMPATMETGVRTVIEVSRAKAGGGTGRLAALELSPLPILQDYVGYPTDIGQVPGWTGEVLAICEVTPEGVCGRVDVAALPGMPESARRFAKASLELWRFEPQRVGGVPVVGEYRLNMRLTTGDAMPEDFRADKLSRILRSR